MSPEYDPYVQFDEILDRWAAENGINFIKQYQDIPVRTFWVYDQDGHAKAQIWLDLAEETLILHASELDPTSPTKWGRKETRSPNVGELISQLDELKQIAFHWAAPNAFS
jgi:hypothetical protein